MLVDNAAVIFEPHDDIVARRGDIENRTDLLAQRGDRRGFEIAFEIDDEGSRLWARVFRFGLVALFLLSCRRFYLALAGDGLT